MKIEIPKEIGEVINSEEFDTEKKVILIPVRTYDRYAQEKAIERAIEYLHLEYGIRLFMTEGSPERIDVQWMRDIPDRSIVRKIVEGYVQSGEITGLESVLVLSDYPILGLGIEDQGLYEESQKVMTEVSLGRLCCQTFVNEFGKILRRLRYEAKCPSLELDKIVDDYAVKENLEVCLTSEYEIARRLGIDVRTNYHMFHIAESVLRNANPYAMQAKVLRSLLNDKGAGPEEEEVYHMSAKQAITNLVFSEDETRLRWEIMERLAITYEQKELARLQRNFEVLSRIIVMDATPGMFSEFRARRHEFSSNHINESLSRFSVKIDDKECMTLDRSLPAMERFYELAHKRHQVYVNRTLGYIDSEGEDVAVILTCGINLDNISRLLNEKKVSYCSFMVTERKEDVETTSTDGGFTSYLERIKNPRVPDADVLTEEEAESLADKLPAYAAGYTVLSLISSGCYKRAIILQGPEGDRVALKVVNVGNFGPRQNQYLAQRGYTNPLDLFAKEGDRMAKFNSKNNPHITRMLDFAVDRKRGICFFVEEYSERTLGDYITKHPRLPLEEVKDIALQLADGLGEVHRMGTYHGDLKPDNILYKNAIISITDWDLASSMPDSQKEMYKIPHSRIKAPELFSGHDLGPVSDVWAYGVTVYFVGTGEMPFPHDFKGDSAEWKRMTTKEREDYEQNVFRHINDESFYQGVIRNIRKIFDRKYANAISRCLERDHTKRYQNACEVHNALKKGWF